MIDFHFAASASWSPPLLEHFWSNKHNKSKCYRENIEVSLSAKVYYNKYNQSTNNRKMWQGSQIKAGDLWTLGCSGDSVNENTQIFRKRALHYPLYVFPNKLNTCKLCQVEGSLRFDKWICKLQQKSFPEPCLGPYRGDVIINLLPSQISG